MKKLNVPLPTTLLIWTLSALTLMIGWCPPQGWAMLAPAVAEGMAAETGRTADLQVVQQVLESKIVRQRLLDLGLTPDEVQSRLARLSDDELHQMAVQIDTLIPGGDPVVGIVIALLVIAILVVILVWLLNNKVTIEKK